ncbi:hypothetical protein COW46_03375 [Candidatus Gracilibacteria bacterium CG17_big_fil_post_rev_8_21_14_2_50_48_13]|nr:MAG: hypothetical protein COW46_03375 [Candidatus Gracilibacteria bacterium CG17_big_fil_post_rev_8_21_14_2_50_48_13]
MHPNEQRIEEEFPLNLSTNVELPDGLAEGVKISFKNHTMEIVETGHIIRLQNENGLRSALGLDSFLDHYASGNIVKQ